MKLLLVFILVVASEAFTKPIKHTPNSFILNFQIAKNKIYKSTFVKNDCASKENSKHNHRPAAGYLQNTGPLLMNDGQGESNSRPIIVGISAILLVLYVGNLVISPFQEVVASSSSTVTVQVDETGKTKTVGKLVGLMRSEINAKLSQIPLFYLETSSGAVFVAEGKGKFYLSAPEARAALETIQSENSEAYSSLKINAATLDEVYYPLIAKKSKVGSFVQGVASLSDTTAEYSLVSGRSSIKDAKETNSEIGVSDVPLFFSRKIQFQPKRPGEKNQIPLFLEKDDLATTWARLRESNALLPVQPDIEVTSFQAIVSQMEKGGAANTRQYEFYPSLSAIDAYGEIYGN